MLRRAIARHIRHIRLYGNSEERAAHSAEELRDIRGADARWPEHRWLWRMGLADRKGGDMAQWPDYMRQRQFPDPRRTA